MTDLIKVSDLKAQLESLPDDLPVFMFDLHSDEAYPLQQVDPTISDRVDLNFTSEKKSTYRAHVAVYHSFVVEASSDEEARRIASEEVNWSHHVTDSEIVVEMETGGSEDD